MNLRSTKFGLGFILTTLLFAQRGAAATPSIQECLEASEASISLSSEHKLLAERAALLVCAAESCPTEIRKECIQRAEASNAAIPTIIFEYKDEMGQDQSAVSVVVDGKELANRLDGTPLEVDPGAHVFQFLVTNHPTIERQFVLSTGQKNRREVIRAISSPGSVSVTKKEAKPQSDVANGLGSQRIGALIAGGLGVVGLAIGGVYGGLAMSRRSRAEAACPESQCSDPDGTAKWDEAYAAGNVATVALIAGGVALATGAVLWLTASPRASAPAVASTVVGVGPGMVQLKGTF